MVHHQHDNRSETIKNGAITLLFWLLFTLSNWLIFLPAYYINSEQSSFWPVPAITRPYTDLSEPLLISRNNFDMFRLSLEWTLLITLWVILPRLRGRFLAILISLLYLLQIIYVGYEAFMYDTYLLAPNFYNDYLFVTNGAGFAFQSLDLSLATFIGRLLLFIGGLGALIWMLYRLLLTDVTLGLATRLTLIILMAGGLYASSQAGIERERPETAVAAFSLKLYENIGRSRGAYANADRFNTETIHSYYTFTQNALAQTPNIYVIFIESYGSVIYKRDDFLIQYLETTERLEQELAKNSWQVASNRSHAPIWGGGSWVAYTSALSGLRLENHTEYQTFLNQYQQESFPHLFNYLRDQGYRSYRISGMAAEIDEWEWDRYRSFYGVDEWIRFSDLDYSGPLYGWGPALPDQFALNFAHERMQQDASPHVFFYITQNSHYPWAPLPKIVPDWRTLNEAPPAAEISGQSHEQLRQSYIDSIDYELEMLVDFIIREASKDDIFILMGDHQPARVARRADGWDTPIHIIGRNTDFIQSFLKMGFVEGLDVGPNRTAMYHEGFYTLFTRSLQQVYGLEPHNAAAYLPRGVPFNNQSFSTDGQFTANPATQRPPTTNAPSPQQSKNGDIIQ